MQIFRPATLVLSMLILLPGVATHWDVRAAGPGDLPSLSQLSRPPLDTLDAEGTRIWLPIERANPCLVKVNVLDDSDQVIRHLVDQLLPGGYYNFYWDKRDDSGEYVAEGEYRYRVRDCGKRSGGELSVQYTDWERTLSIVPTDDSVSGAFVFELSRDSALVSARVLNKRLRPIDEPITDSLMHSGRHLFVWTPPQPGYVGNFLVHLTVGDHTREIEITLRRKPR